MSLEEDISEEQLLDEIKSLYQDRARLCDNLRVYSDNSEDVRQMLNNGGSNETISRITLENYQTFRNYQFELLLTSSKLFHLYEIFNRYFPNSTFFEDFPDLKRDINSIAGWLEESVKKLSTCSPMVVFEEMKRKT